MSEISKQQKRIENIVVKTGKAPTVLDIEPSLWDAVISEIRSDNRYRGCIMPSNSGWESQSEIPENPEDVKVIQLFGVRFCKGRT
jgi:hypothetical protein